MSWESRIKPAAYISPTGDRIAFLFEDVERQTTSRSVSFQFPRIDGTYMQDLGRSGRTYPMRCIFNGQDHDLQATSFENALLTRGVGKLEHPFYGTFNVVPSGSIRRIDALKTSANETVISVSFLETGELLSASVDVSEYEAEEKAEIALASISKEFDSKIKRYEQLTQIDNPLPSRYDYVSTFRDIVSLARGILGFAQPIVDLDSRQLSRVISEANSAPDRFYDFLSAVQNETPSRAAVHDLAVGAALVGAGMSIAGADYNAQPDAIAAAALYIEQYDKSFFWRSNLQRVQAEKEFNTEFSAVTDSASAYVGAVINAAFGLRKEKSYVTQKDESFIVLVSNLYLNLNDSIIEEFISANRLTADEIFIIPKGREIVYYI